MNGAPLPSDGTHPPYPLRLIGAGATGGNSVGNIVEIELYDFQTPVEAPKLHIVKYAEDRTTVIDETTVDYVFMEANFAVIGDGITRYKYQGLTLDPTDLWDPTETKGMNPPKIDNAIKGTRVRDLVEQVGGMGTGTDIIFVASDGWETVLGYSNIYTNPAVQSRQGDAIIAWYADGQYMSRSTRMACACSSLRKTMSSGSGTCTKHLMRSTGTTTGRTGSSTRPRPGPRRNT